YVLLIAPHTGEHEDAIPRKRLPPVDVARIEGCETPPARGRAHRAPPLGGREAATSLVRRLVKLAHHRVERPLVVARVSDHDVEQKAGERAFRIVDVPRAVHRMD